MGLWEWLTNPLKRAELERADLEYQEALMEHQKRILEGISNEANRAVPQGWRIITGGMSGTLNDVDDNVSESDYYEIISESMRLWIENETYRGIIKNLVRSVFGKGPTLSPKMRQLEPGEDYTDEEKAAAARSEAYFDAFWKANAMALKDKEIGRRAIRDGDAFLNFMSAVDDVLQKMAKIEDREVPVPSFRFLAASKVRDSDGQVSMGVQCEDGDPETPEAYHYDPGDGSGKRVIPAKYVIQVKGEADSDWKRGLPVLLASHKTVTKRDRFVTAALDRIELQNCVVMHAEYSNVNAMDEAREANRVSSPSDTPQNVQKAFKPRTIVRSGKGVNYKFFNPQMEGARGEDGRLFDLQCARNAGVTEYEVSADASAYRNRSTADIISDPSVRTKEDFQDTFGFYLKLLAEKVIRWGKEISGGYLLDGDPEEFEIEWPPLTSRNAIDDAKAFDLDTAHGLSDRTYLERRGYDPDQEFARRKLEASEQYDEDDAADDQEDEQQDDVAKMDQERNEDEDDKKEDAKNGIQN